MQRAWVMLKRSRGHGRNFWDAERRLQEWMGSQSIPFKLAVRLFGEFDFVLIFEARTPADVHATIKRISRDLADEVVSTTTYLATEVPDADALIVPATDAPAEHLHCVAMRTLPGTGDETRDALKRLAPTLPATASLKIVDCVFGDYDVMMLFACPYEQAYEVLAKAASTIPTIRKTTTMLSTGFRMWGSTT